MNDFDSRPTYLADLLLSMETPRPFWSRVQLWLFTPLSWKGTKMQGVSLHGLSTSTYAKWNCADADRFGGRNP